MDPRTHFGYGIYLNYDDFTHWEDEIPKDEDLNDRVNKIFKKVFGLEEIPKYPGFEEGKDVVFVSVDSGDENYAIFIKSTYFCRDWNENGDSIDPALFTTPENALEILAKALDALDLEASKIEKACYFIMNYQS